MAEEGPSFVDIRMEDIRPPTEPRKSDPPNDRSGRREGSSAERLSVALLKRAERAYGTVTQAALALECLETQPGLESEDDINSLKSDSEDDLWDFETFNRSRAVSEMAALQGSPSSSLRRRALERQRTEPAKVEKVEERRQKMGPRQCTDPAPSSRRHESVEREVEREENEDCMPLWWQDMKRNVHAKKEGRDSRNGAALALEALGRVDDRDALAIAPTAPSTPKAFSSRPRSARVKKFSRDSADSSSWPTAPTTPTTPFARPAMHAATPAWVRHRTPPATWVRQRTPNVFIGGQVQQARLWTGRST